MGYLDSPGLAQDPPGNEMDNSGEDYNHVSTFTVLLLCRPRVGSRGGINLWR